MSSLRIYPCPFCDRRVVADDATSTLRHELPTCDHFHRAMACFGLQSIKVDPAIFVVDVPRKPVGQA